jgi:hypothetical protein
MGWFRSNRSVVTWLALFALACQLLLSFGHVHASKFGGGSAAWASAENRDASAGVAPSSPQKIPIGHSGDFCAICANISLAGILVVPILTIVLAPNLFTDVLRWSFAHSARASIDDLPFDARGPPHA